MTCSNPTRRVGIGARGIAVRARVGSARTVVAVRWIAVAVGIGWIAVVGVRWIAIRRIGGWIAIVAIGGVTVSIAVSVIGISVIVGACERAAGPWPS